MSEKYTLTSDSANLTKRIGSVFADTLVKTENKKGARIILLKGDLGSGKTTFVIGFLKYFGIIPTAASPTFVIMKRYDVDDTHSTRSARSGQIIKDNLKKEKFTKIENIYHLDAYRLKSREDLKDLDFDEIVKNPENIILIEWPEKIKGYKFKNKMEIGFEYGKGDNERVIYFRN